jgi:hypothetical protein
VRFIFDLLHGLSSIYFLYLQNFPREYTRTCLKKSHAYVYLMDVASGKHFRSPVLASTRNVDDKFIYSGWKKFIQENGLRFGDKLILSAPSGDNYIEIRIIRSQVLY